ncbi:uncharacterized protein A1O5_00964 [Cladophialophora psammophila CBS 110553]|uniref:ubiquitinyl hydrolase 1 n=1 Tax=Cladophialophora psammophila CBS 110553 TaxID=1182543 RepID=W9XHN6_9EURO|nr:uncharacterized protein A1O5_00964 [Cladophialophora psammophila CBS 110553]EXJ76456.1 hypothetical protein A1O5_00964 [Cladophialophora psammophila CBS 110553]
MRAEAVSFIFEQVFLPPKLPQEYHNESGADDLLKEISHAARDFSHGFPVPSNERHIWTQLSRSLIQWIKVYDRGVPCRDVITTTLENIRQDDVLLFYIEPQNAAILVRNRPKGAVFECFEVLAKTSAVVNAKDALIRHFPTRAAFLSKERLADKSFIKELGNAIYMLSVEPLQMAMEKTKKGDNIMVEERQSVHPRAVSEWLFSILGACGKAASSVAICKRVHDDVCWKNAHLPWSRSGVWLSARVALQIALINADLEGVGNCHYKNFMLFLLSRVAVGIVAIDSKPDVLHVLRVKLARRNAKLGSSTFGFVQNIVDSTLNLIEDSIRRQWTEAIERDTIIVPLVPLYQVSDQLMLKNSRPILDNTWSRSQKAFTYSITPYTPPSSARVALSKRKLPQVSTFTTTEDILFCLVDFELWVEECLSSWLAANMSTSSACTSLARLMQKYYAVAKGKYQSHVERVSLMLLTLFELWVALDTIASTIYPLLYAYPPEFPVKFFEPLLLRNRTELERLSKIELHIRSRQSRCTLNNPSLFADPSPECFAVRFYDQSSDLQNLRARVEQDAHQAKRAKSREWEQKKREFDTLMKQVEQMECGVFTPRGVDEHGKPYIGRPRHDRFCRKCEKEKIAKNIKISKHEWPLPEDETMCKAVIFELATPESIVSWRDATFFLLHDVGRARNTIGSPPQPVLLSYAPLEKYAQRKNRRITLASSVKPVIQSHYLRASLNVDPVFVSNGLHPRMRDTSTLGLWTAEQTSIPSLHRYCYTKLIAGSDGSLDEYVNLTSHTQNRVISQQSRCPSEMGSHEYVLFGSLRSGERLQLFNVLGAFMSAEIDFNSPATALLFRYAISQVGTARCASPLYLRESQIVLEDEHFSCSLLDALESAFLKIEVNFKEAAAAAILVGVVLKALSLSSFSQIATRCMNLVLQIRQSALGWIRQMNKLYADHKNAHADNSILRDLSRQILTACILCRRTYGVDTEAQPSMFSDHDAVADYVEASVHLHTHRKSHSDTKDPKNKMELLNDAYLARRNEKHLLVAFQLNESAITDGIKRFWTTAVLTDKWQLVHRDDSSWISNRASSKVVHYNLVTGSLLVSGRAISQLPAQYTSSPLYRSIFGELDLDVFAADTEDMEYVSKDDFHGHRVYFGMRGDVLLIRSQNNDETFEAIQRDHFRGDLPRVIVEDTTPWMSLRDGRVEFRSRKRPFRSDVSDWTLITDVKSGSKKRMYADQKYLIDTHSQVGSIICNALRPIEQSYHIVVTFCKNTTIEIELPRYHLHFFVDFQGRIVCKELSAFVDSDQALGTLHGFRSRLILRTTSKLPGSNLRTVLIPHGDVSITAAPPHISAQVQLDDTHSVSFSQFRVDVRLGQLISQDLEAHLYKAYLHAITSFPESDSLTGRTGTEESLFALSDHICRTCQPLSKRAQAILSLIAQLTPGRKFYPPHLKTMQTVTFDNILPVMAQRDIFFGTVHKIIAHNMKADWLFDANVTAIPYKGDFALLDRSHHRTRKLFPSESVASMSHSVNDENYCSRDQELDRNFRASADMACLVESSQSAFSVDTSWTSKIQTWKKVSGFSKGFTFNSFSSLLGQDFRDIFPRLMGFCRSASTSKESLMFVLSLLAFEQPAIGEQLRALLAFAISPALRDLAAPRHDSYDLRDGHTLHHKEILMLLSQCEQPFVPSQTSEADEDRIAEERLRFRKELAAQRESILEALRKAWPCETVQLPAEQSLNHYKVSELEVLLDGRVAVWHKNYLFLQLLEDYDRRLEAFNTSWTGPDIPDTIVDFEHTTCSSPQDTHFSLLGLMAMTPITVEDFNESEPTGLDGDLSQLVSQKLTLPLLESNQARSSWEDLEDIVEDLSCDSSVAVREYGQLLGNSIEAMKSRSDQAQPKMKLPSSEVLTQKLEESRGHIAYVLARTCTLLRPRLPSYRGLVTAKIWPQVSELTLLQLLSAKHRKRVTACWMPVLLQFAREITAAQRVERLQKYLDTEDAFALNNELANPAHSVWSPEERPDWLLLECQNNFLIRPVQIQVAKELLKPENGTVLLGMGEGKTSVILNLVVTALARGSHLVRVVVLKPLAQEMLRLLSRSLAGLVGRTLYYLPFSRQTTLTAETPQRLMSLYQECRQTGGILLTLPEYLNSFRLVGIDKLAQDTHDIATKLIRVQKWLDFNARDVLDESDELLKPAYELVYTNGEANLLSGAPDRWNISLEILDLIRKKAKALYIEFPKAVEVEIQSRGSFPHVRVLNEDGAAAVANLVTKAIVDGQLPSLSLGHCNPHVLQAISSFILNVDIEAAQLELVARHFQSSAKLDLLYVARGLVSHQILSHTLRKRWKVNYGLDRTRTLSAVPYRAKSVPSPSAEFAQPEASIILTALSFYYTGILRPDLRRCLLILLRLPDPADAYGKWVKYSGLPGKYSKVNSINLDDASCVDILYDHLRYNSELISFFLRHVVYPSEAKEFRYKLSTSAWDLCQNVGVLTVGFSGTCDSKIPIVQKDLPDLRHITASTLSTLLRYENRQYFCAASPSGQRLTTKKLLQRITADGLVDVIIDVGAQMLEGNKEIAQLCLQISPKKMATIFFSDNDEKMVLNRDGSTESLASSIFKDELKSCLIFLDQFHTRGTDFQLPDNFTAAVLLGPGILKDNLAQACMRMRKLAVSQRVRFYAPPEVDQAIRSITNDPSGNLDSLHVVRWAINESCLALKKQDPQYITRGLLHSRRRLAADRHISSDGKITNPEQYLDTIRERECRPVSELYCASGGHGAELPFEPTFKESQDSVIQCLRADLERIKMVEFEDSGITQEQEREILHEVEEEREVQRPREVLPATPQHCQRLLDFIRNGTPLTGTPELRPCFEILEQTRLALYYHRDFPAHVLVTRDFMRTVQNKDDSPEDDFLRPVQWVVKTSEINQLIIISPHEADVFFHSIRESTRATMHMYQARTSRGMVSFDALNICKLPANNASGEITPQAVALLGLFAGQLYFTSFEHYKEFCTLTGLFDGERPLPHKRQVANDNFVSPSCRKANGWTECTFKTSPVTWIKGFIDMRRAGIEWTHTHMGRVLNGQILRRQDFEEEDEEKARAQDMEELSLDGEDANEESETAESE